MDTNNTTTEQNTSQAQQPSILDAALAYAARGWAVTPLIGKGAFLDEWNTLPFSDEAFIRQEFARPGVSGIGLRTGVVSGGLIDVDLDSVEAERIAPAVLAKTNAIFGRRAKPRSHYLYRLPVGQSLRGMKFCDPLREEGDGKVLLELRGELLQSMAPVSLHPSGERVEWATEGDPAEVDVDDQLQQAHTLAAAALLARYWPYNNRQDAALALCGGLLRAGWEPEDVRDFLRHSRCRRG